MTGIATGTATLNASQRAKTLVAMECEVAWLAYEEGLLDVVGGESAATTEPVSMPLAAPAA